MFLHIYWWHFVIISIISNILEYNHQSPSPWISLVKCVQSKQESIYCLWAAGNENYCLNSLSVQVRVNQCWPQRTNNPDFPLVVRSYAPSQLIYSCQMKNESVICLLPICSPFLCMVCIITSLWGFVDFIIISSTVGWQRTLMPPLLKKKCYEQIILFWSLLLLNAY